MAFSLQEALQQIRSDKIKDRQQGLETLEHIFSEPDVVFQLDARRDGKPWLKTFQSLFACVLNEKASCVKKGSWRDAQPASVARLQRAAQILRSLVEKASALLQQKVVRALVVHIVQMMDSHGALFEPVAKAYIPALAAILQHPHHVDHLEEDDWTATANLCLNALMAQDLGTEPCTDFSYSSSSMSNSKPARSLSLEDAGLATCLQYLLVSDMAPILGSDGCGRSFLHDYTAFLVAHTTESSAHLPILRGLVRLVDGLELNATQDVILSALATRPTILSLWQTKNRPLKVQLLLYLRIITPLLISFSRPSFELFQGACDQDSTLKSKARGYVEAIHRALMDDAGSRWGFEPLLMSSISFCRPNQKPTPPQTGFFNDLFGCCDSDTANSETSGIAWTKLHLHVDILRHLTQTCFVNSASTTHGTDFNLASDDDAPSATRKRVGPPLASTARKRGRTADHGGHAAREPLYIASLTLLTASYTTTPLPQRISLIQLLVFFILEAWADIDVVEVDMLFETATSMVADTAADVSAWAMVAVAAIVHQTEHNSQHVSDTRMATLAQAWSIASRQLSSPSSCRVSAFLLNYVLVYRAIPDSKILGDVQMLFKDFAVQGPPILCDSVCHLLSTLLDITTSKKMFDHLQPRSRLCTWTMANVRLESTNLSSQTPLEDVFHLITQLISSKSPVATSVLACNSSVPAHDTLKLHQQRMELKELRDLVLDAVPGQEVQKSLTVSSIKAEFGGTSLISPDDSRQIADWTSKQINASLVELKQSSTQDGSNVLDERTIGRLESMVQHALLGLVVASSISDTVLSHASAELLCAVLDLVLSTNTFTPSERASVFQQLLTITPHLAQSEDPVNHSNSLLRFPGQGSGIASSLPNPAGSTYLDFKDEDIAISSAWGCLKDFDDLPRITDLIYAFLDLALFEESDSANEMGAEAVLDDFGEADQSQRSVSNTTRRGSNLSPCVDVALDVAIRLITHLHYGVLLPLTGKDSPVEDESLMKALLDSPVHHFVTLTPAVLDLRARGKLEISDGDLSEIVERIGMDVLGTYQFARSPEARLSALKSVSSIVPITLSEQSPTTDICAKALKLAAFFADQTCRTKRRSGWAVRIACARLLGKCLAFDPRETLWRNDNGRSSSRSPSRVLLKINLDDDIRVRALGSPISASMFASEHLSEAETNALYADFRESLPVDSANPRQILTRGLTLASVAICSSIVRRTALFHLIEIVLAFGGLPDVIQHLFAAVAQRLGFTDAASFFDEFASELTWGMIINDYDPLQLPWKVVGFDSRRSCLTHNFVACANMLLAVQTEQTQAQFETLIRLTGYDDTQARKECLPFLFASHLGFSAQAANADGGEVAPDVISQGAVASLQLIGYSDTEEHARNSLVPSTELVVVALLSLYYEPGKDNHEASEAAIGAARVQSADWAEMLGRLSPQYTSASPLIHEPSRPHFSALVICDSLVALDNLGIDVFHVDAVFNVLPRVFSQIGSSRFVNSQLRLFAALRLYLAMCGNTVWKDPMNVAIMLRSITALLDCPHLRPDLKSLTEQICSTGTRMLPLSDNVVNCILKWALLPISSATEISGTQASADHDDWLLKIASQLGRTSASSLSTLVLLWPRSLTDPEHTAVEKLLDVDSITAALQTCGDAAFTHKSLGRIAKVLQKASSRDVAAFCKTSGQLLMARLSTSGSHPGDVDCADVIGEIVVLTSDHHDLSGKIRVDTDAQEKKNARAALVGSSADQWLTCQAALMVSVLAQTHSSSLQRSYRAFLCVRGMVSNIQSRAAKARIKYPSNVQKELARFRFLPFTGKLFIKRSAMSDLVSSEVLSTASSFDDWIRKVSSILCGVLGAAIDDHAFVWLRQLVVEDGHVARELFAEILVCFTAIDRLDLVDVHKKTRESILQEHRTYLASCRDTITQHFETVLKSSHTDKQCWESIIQALLSVREWRGLAADSDSTPWFGLDSVLLARRCIDCELYTAAVFFIENDASEGSDGNSSTNAEAVELLHKAYASVSDPDAFYGITQGHVQDLLIKRLHHEGQWQRAFEYHAAEYEAHQSSTRGSRLAVAGIGQSLGELGFSRLSNALSHTTGALQDNTNASLLSTWDLPMQSSSALLGDVNVNDVLQVLHQSSSEDNVDGPLARAFASTTRSLGSISAESVSNFQKAQGNLLVLRQIKQWRDVSSRLGPDEAVTHFVKSWALHDIPADFVLSEKVLTARQSILQAARQRTQSDEIGDVMTAAAEKSARLERLILVVLSSRARDHGKLQIAMNATARAQMLEMELGDDAKIALQEFASVLWEQQEHAPAIQLLSEIVDGLRVTSNSQIKQRCRKAQTFVKLAQWRATARSQHPREIDKLLFEPALTLTKATTDAEKQALSYEQSKVAYTWARFAEENYRNSNVAEISRLELYIERRQDEIMQNQNEYDRCVLGEKRSKLLQFQRQAEKILRQDKAHLRELEASRTLFLQRSVVMYARSLATSDYHQDAVARLISLWFEFSDDVELNKLLSTCLDSIPSRKFLSLMHQLSARLSGNDASPGSFQANLSNLVLRICQHHPYHTMYAIFALAEIGRKSGARPTSLTPQALRTAAAERIWTQVKKQPLLSQRMRVFQETCLAYSEWAEYDLTSQPQRYFQANGAIKKGSLRLPPQGELRLARLRDVDVPVATAELEVDHTCNYASFVSVVRYSDTFSTAGGLNVPKISECMGSDGRRYKQLFKRNDDLRQDAVMQQVFRLVNELLAQDRRTRERQLLVRTYSVIPLGPQCGLLEFVVNTTPVADVLVAMHAKYRPSDISPTQARNKLRDAQSLAAADKLEVFLDVCDQMQPAMRYFFTETQKSPQHWFATRLNYTRSVATNSIVGHLLGLGDRHVSNILLDKQSGELVHIDFGVAFDQGRLLPIPELVPFRLTRDFVDGMGMNGVEGTFRRCCEETLRVLRAHQDVIRTVLEVFKHDPLFAWTSNPIKVLRAQQDDTDSIINMPSMERSRSISTDLASAASMRGANRRPAAEMDTAELSADRAITSVMTKLSSTLSVEYTVNDLIQQAMDAGNLSSIFCGWQAAL